MYASRDKLSDNLRLLSRQGIPTLERNIKLMEDQRAAATDKKSIECFDATLVKMDAIKNYATTHHKLFATRVMQDEFNSSDGPAPLNESQLTLANKIVLELCNMCSMEVNLWRDQLDRLFRSARKNPLIPVLVIYFGGAVASTIALCSSKGCLTMSSLLLPGWFLIGGIVAYICYAIYKRFYPTPTSETSDEARKFAKLLKHIESGNISLDLGQIIKDMKELMGEMNGYHEEMEEDDRACCVCALDMAVCRHIPGAPHDPTCAVLPFDCRHPLCHTCAEDTRLDVCPQCRATRIL